MLHPPSPSTPRRSPRPPPRADPPKKPPDSPARRLARRRSWKPPDPDTVPPPAPDTTPREPPGAGSPELDPAPTPSPAPETDPPESDPGAAVADAGGDAGDAFDDKEVDPADGDGAACQIHPDEAPPEESPEIDPPPEIEPPGAGPPESGNWTPKSKWVGVGSGDRSQSFDLSPDPDPAAAETGEGAPAIGMQETGRKMQRIVDLVMWRDASRSALVFGTGTFLIISSSYAGDLNFSLISGVSYVGLFYLAGIFLLNSIRRRGTIDYECEERWIVGEDEVLMVIRMILPYVNEILIRLKALFSGDPSTTMKMAMLLFALARCGGSITFWTMGKLAFFGMFTIPRIFASYSSHICRYGTFWLERFKDAWETCTHKKAAAAAAFTIIWNLSSTPARVWSVFMLAVAVRCYHENASKGWGCLYEDEYEAGDEHNLDNDDQEQQQQRQKERPKQQERGGGGVCKMGKCMTTLTVEPSGKGRATAVAATVIAKRPQGQRPRGGVASKLEMGTKEKKSE